MPEYLGTQDNASFSSQVPGLQIVWDSTSLGALKKCPRLYYLTHVMGYVPRAQRVDLEFGIFAHSTRERYYHARAQGAPHDKALDVALDYLLRATWDARLGRPWSTTDANKNRLTLVRSMVWYLDQFAEDTLATLILGNGKPAVELSFRFETTYLARTGEPFQLAGHLDRAVVYNGAPKLSDLKTTKHTIDQKYREQFTPDNQFSLYDFAAPIVLGPRVDPGIVVDAIQVAVTFTRMERFIVTRTQSQRDEWYDDLGMWLSMAEGFARAQRWPHNDRNCFRCDLRAVCRRPPGSREQWLASDYERRVWDPTRARGDV